MAAELMPSNANQASIFITLQDNATLFPVMQKSNYSSRQRKWMDLMLTKWNSVKTVPILKKEEMFVF